MNTQSITLDFPSDILTTLNESEAEFKKDIKLSLAIRLYNLQKLTLGKAAEIADVSKFEFETKLSEYGFTISHLTFDDVINDLQKLK